MSAPRTPGSPYHGKYKPKTPVPSVPRRRVGHYIRADLDERLAMWANQECVSKSRIIEHLIERHLAVEDPDGTCFVSEVIIPPKPKKAPPFPPTLGDLYPNSYPPYPVRLPPPRPKPTPFKEGFNEYGRMPI
jgi:hypothetical protein